MKVLLCDDSRTIRMILARTVRELGGTEIREASDGREALHVLSEEQFDLILLDINMPELDGLKALNEIKAPGSTHADTPVVIVSSNADHRRIEEAKKLGAFGYVMKPFKAKNLMAAFEEASKVRRLGGTTVGIHGRGVPSPKEGPSTIPVQ